MRKTDRERFDSMQSEIRSLMDERRALEIDLTVRYGDKRYAPRGLQNRFEKIDARVRRISDRYFVLLDRISLRDWRVGPPWAWVLTKLTYEDATTRGALSVVPPVAYGGTQQEMQAFARPVAA